MSYTHLTISERSKIETYLELGYSIRAISKRIHRSPSTISRELRRHQNCSIEEAQTSYQSNKSNYGAKLKLTAELKYAVQEKLQETWSPEQIGGRLYPGKLSFKSIYRWIYDGLLEVPVTVLRQKENGKSPVKQEVGSTLAHRFLNDQQRFGNGKPLGIGNSMPLFQDVVKQRVVLPRSSSVKHGGTLAC